MALYSTATLVTAINRRAFIPTGQTTFSEADIYAIASEQIRNEILPMIMAIREEYFVYHTDYAITANKQVYDIPPRAIGMIVREIHYVNTSGNISKLNRLEPEQITSTTRTASIPNDFFIKNNQIWLVDIPSSTDGATLRVYFMLQPNELIATTDAAVISNINTNTNVVSVSTIPSSWVTGNIFDFIRQDGGQECVDFDKTSTTVSGTDITFASLPSALRVGDYVALQGYSPLVQLPSEFRDLVAQAVACFILEKMKLPGADTERRNYEKSLMNIRNMLAPRTQGSPRAVPIPSFI
jgi:hypothetical protein